MPAWVRAQGLRVRAMPWLAQVPRQVLALGAVLQTVVCSAVVWPIRQARQQAPQRMQCWLGLQQVPLQWLAGSPVGLLLVVGMQQVGVMLSVWWAP